jgi:hypothetical protein
MTATQRIAAARKSIRKQGPCALCGGKYAAHRVVDAQVGRVVAGDSMESVADDYRTDVATMLATWAALLDLLNEGSADEKALMEMGASIALSAVASAEHEEPRKRRLPKSKNGAA